jgi:hypothetical protein
MRCRVAASLIPRLRVPESWSLINGWETLVAETVQTAPLRATGNKPRRDDVIHYQRRHP